MARWEPGARGRLTQAALELYAERGFEQTTALEVAERAGVTERTFFRHFADKREVLFDRSAVLLDAVLAVIDAAPSSVKPIDLVGTAMEAAAPVLQDRRDYARKRAAVIAANSSLHERELLKLATLGGAVADALRRRGVADPTATLAAETGVTVFKVAFEQWIAEDSDRDFGHCIREVVGQLRELTVDA